MGTTFIANLSGCRRNVVDAERARELALSCVHAAGMTPIGETCVTVTDGVNSGATAVIVVVPLKESHLAIHTWPEKQFVWAEFATCGDYQRASRAFDDMCHWFEPRHDRREEVAHYIEYAEVHS